MALYSKAQANSTPQMAYKDILVSSTGQKKEFFLGPSWANLQAALSRPHPAVSWGQEGEVTSHHTEG